MIRQYQSFRVTDTDTIKSQMLNWANQFNICCFMDNHNYKASHSSYECLLAVNAFVTLPAAASLAQVDDFIAANNDWIFGHFNYEFPIDELSILPPNKRGFLPSFLFVPQILVTLTNNVLTIGSIGSHPLQVYTNILQSSQPEATIPTNIQLIPRLPRQQYLSTINSLLEHIKRGDCYEINFCQEFYAEDVNINVLQLYQTLVRISPNPFACYYRLNNQHLLCASPERYIKKTGNKIISQPIKGTLTRLPETEGKIDHSDQLYHSDKDRAENVMVVDLVRNDLSKVCKRGSVKVDELFGIYTFPQLYQMISTISGQLKEGTTLGQILRATFPMGSMTGAPKKRVMELIQQYETGARGIYSGTVGYITPHKDVDFNVVIRSLVFNGDTNYLSYHVGSGITAYSTAGHEYDECNAKATAIVSALTAKK